MGEGAREDGDIVLQGHPFLTVAQLEALYPLPWEVDFYPHEVPERRSAAIYAKDSTLVSRVNGERALELASIIVASVNESITRHLNEQKLHTSES